MQTTNSNLGEKLDPKNAIYRNRRMINNKYDR